MVHVAIGSCDAQTDVLEMDGSEQAMHYDNYKLVL